MKKILIILFVMFLATAATLNFATAQNESEITSANSNVENEITLENSESEIRLANSESESENKVEKKVLAREEGNYNISFDDGYYGYCINYMKNHALVGDSFTVKDTSYAVNNNRSESIGNYLKVFFVDYYEEAMKNKIVTQHTIWHFSDDFHNWRIDYDLVDKIKATALTKTIPDHGAVRKINNTTEAVFDFEVLLSGSAANQNFFGYKITYRNISSDIENNESDKKPANIVKNSTVEENENTTHETYNTTQENNSNTSKNSYNSTSNNKYHTASSDNENKSVNNHKANLSKHVTGNSSNIMIALLTVLLSFVLIRHVRD